MLIHQTLPQIDGIIILAYFSAVLAVGLSSSRRKDGDSAMYFLSGRDLGWFSIGASFIAADTLCGHIVGISGPFSGVLAIDMELVGIVGLTLLGWWFGPEFIKRKIFTITDLLDRRYREKAGAYVSASYIVIYLLTRLSLVLFMGAFLIRQFSNSDVYVTIAAIVLIAGLYSIVGGFSAVVNTQVFQAVIILAGLGALFLGFADSASAARTTISVSESAFVQPNVGFPWIAFLIGIPLIVFWLLFTDQYMLQHVFGARSQRDLEKGTLLVIVVKVLAVGGLLVWIFLMPSEVRSLSSGMSLSPFYRGLVLIGIFSAMMSSLSGLFNSTSALFTLDLYKRKHPDDSERKLVLVGRLSTTAAVVLSLLWMPLLSIFDWQGSSSLQSLLAYFAAIVAAVFISGMLWKRATPLAVACALVVGTAVGTVRLVAEHFVNPDLIKNDVILWLVQTHYLNFASIVFVICIFVIVGVSLVVPSRGTGAAISQVQRNP